MEELQQNQIQSGVICAGLSCLDMLLLSSDLPVSPEQICTFKGVLNIAGGSCCNSARALSRFHTQTAVLTVVGNDSFGEEIISQMKELGIDTTCIQVSSSVQTSLSVVPVYKQGGRGCFVDLGANLVLDRNLLLGSNSKETLEHLAQYKIFHFGYPHLLPMLQGESLSNLLNEIKSSTQLVVSLDVNGVASSDSNPLEKVLKEVGFMHANLEEAFMLAGRGVLESFDLLSRKEVENLADFFLSQGLAMIAITLGKDGVCMKLNSNDEVVRDNLGRSGEWILKSMARTLFLPAYSPKGQINTTGAGDAFTAGVLSCLESFECITFKDRDPLESVTQLGLYSALVQIDEMSAQHMKNEASPNHLFILEEIVPQLESVPSSLI
eukprot:CAMPEP_0182451306 /NCGR_PEP_ID=MMETSP1172-20130603/43649_1 /TAXON_ID=708627 /ORGANISM="Timspurckia oligopyrenoides, Strain CCMP3278" /LENGTH=379 /DNA_ID=CAMNT_0024649071 /DNA_START=16 /DNA_END=1155 /DNA_ORIENTATION=+